MDRDRKRFPLVFSQNDRTGCVWLLPIDVRQPEQAPGNNAHQRQIRLEQLGTLQVAVFDGAARLSSVK